MKKISIYIVFSLFIVSCSCVQDSLKKNRNKSVPNIVSTENNTIDTLYYTSDQDYIDITEENLGKIKIIITDKEDYLNYVIPIITLLIGVILEKSIESYNTKKRIYKSAKRWRAELQALINPIERQIKCFNNFISEYGDDIYDIPSIQIYRDLNGDNLKILDKTDFLEYIEHKKKNIETFNQITGVISILENINSNIKNKVDDFTTNSSKCIELFNQGLQRFNQELAELHVTQEDPNSKFMDDNDFKELMILYKSNIAVHLEDSNFNPYEMENLFFKPIITIISKYHSNRTIMPISNSIRECMNAIRALKLEKRYIKDNLSTLSKMYQELSQNIIGMIKKI